MNEEYLQAAINHHYAKEHGLTEGARPAVVALEGKLAVIRCGKCGTEIDNCLRTHFGR